VETRAGRVAVEKAAAAPLAPGVVRDGEVADVETLATALRTLFSEHKLGRRVRLGVANPRIVMRTLDLPPIESEKEISSAVMFQAQDHIPMALDQAVLEHHSLGVVETEQGPRTRVVLVAARREMIDHLLEATKMAGLRPQGIDLSAFAMIRALHQPGATDGTLYLSVGGVTNLAVAVGATCVFTRVVAHGTESMAGELAERRGLTLEHAHGWLKHVGLLNALEEIEGDQEIVHEARAVLMEGVRRIADEVRNSIDFHLMQQGATTVQRAVLTGPAVAIPGFADHLGEELGRPLEVGVVQEGRPGGLSGIDAGRLAVAAGLTVEALPA
jgi:type IV pilus assembly protein PilM